VPNATVFSEVVANHTYERPAPPESNGADAQSGGVAARAKD
jgi:hypothetical protein